MSKCPRFKENEPGLIVNCANCKLWNGTQCKDEVSMATNYHDSDEFKEYEEIMQNNKGVLGPL